MNFKIGLLFVAMAPLAVVGHAGPSDGGKALVVPPLEVDEARDAGWRLSAGYTYRSLGGVDFHTGSFSQHHVLSTLAGRPFQRRTGAGAITGLGDRFYRDGFVRVDSSGSTDGLTWFWGYDSAGQVQGDAVVQTSRPARGRTVSESRRHSPSSWMDDFEAGGPLLNLEYLFPSTSPFQFGAGISVSWVEWGGGSQSSTFRARQSSVTTETVVTDRFGLGGATPPAAPYEGTFTGPGVLLDAVPAARAVSRREVDRSRFEFFNRVDESLDVDLYTLSPGVTTRWQGGKVFADLGGGLAVNIADWKARHREVLYVSRDGGPARSVRSWTNTAGGTEVLWGAFVQAGIGIQCSRQLSVQGFVRYDWSQHLRGSVGPSTFEVDLDGVSGGVVATWSF